MGDLDDIVLQLRAALPELRAVYLFGSTATGNVTSQSDIDLAVLLPRRLDPVARWELQESLAARLRRNVDLVDLQSASAVMRVQVLANGRLLFDDAPAERAAFEAVALADYARLNEERRGILDDVRARGSVHG